MTDMQKDLALVKRGADELLIERQPRQPIERVDWEAMIGQITRSYRLSDDNIDLVERARSVGASAKFAGSGGAIVGTYQDEEMFERLIDAYRGSDTAVIKPTLL